MTRIPSLRRSVRTRARSTRVIVAIAVVCVGIAILMLGPVVFSHYLADVRGSRFIAVICGILLTLVGAAVVIPDAREENGRQ
jgi:hypothetical protein